MDGLSDAMGPEQLSMSLDLQLVLVVAALVAAFAYLVRHVVRGRGPLCTTSLPRRGGCGGCGGGPRPPELVRLPVGRRPRD